MQPDFGLLVVQQGRGSLCNDGMQQAALASQAEQSHAGRGGMREMTEEEMRMEGYARLRKQKTKGSPHVASLATQHKRQQLHGLPATLQSRRVMSTPSSRYIH